MYFRFRPSPKRRRQPARFDSLEPRLVLTASAQIAQPQVVMTAAASATPVGFAPSAIEHAYAFDQIQFSGAAKADGSGQTIAIVDACDDPNIASDLATFDSQYGLAAPPSFTKVAVANSTPTATQAWVDETSLDVEWMHALAPGANIVLVEAASDNDSDLVAAVAKADTLPDVTAISMSWGDTEYSGVTDYDPTFQTPAPHQGITFVASAGDIGAPGLWPALSPYVLSAGATTLTLNNGQYGSEAAWSKTGGGYSQFEPKLPYQNAVNNTNMRASPDVAFDGNPNTGVAVYESGSNPGWRELAGTSFSAVAWAALIALADQGRAAAGLGSLDGAQADLYQLPATDFHDITSGGNGTYNAASGYDLVTGLGTPIANLVVSDLIAAGASIGKSTPAGSATADSGGNQSATVNQTFAQQLTLTVRDAYNDPLPGVAVTFSSPVTGASASFPSGTTLTTDSNGQVSETVKANTIAGSYTVNASVAGLAMPVTFSLTNSPDAAASITTSGGNGQQATVATGFGHALSAVVRDRYGNAVPGATVTFAAPGSGPSTSFAAGTTAVTGSNGQASVNVTGNTIAGSYTVTASVAGVSSAASFQLTNLPDTPASMSVALGDQQQTTIGTTFAYPLTVDVADRFGNSVPGATVTFTAPSNQASAVLSAPGTATTNAAGEASLSATANDLAGNYTISASVAGVSTPVSFRLANEPTGTRASISSSTAQNASVFGQGVTFTAIVVPLTPGVKPPVGQVTFLDNGTTLGTANLSVVNGLDEAVFSPNTPLAVGQYSITAQYAGDANDTPSSQSLTQTVSESNVTVGVESSAPMSGVGRAITLTAIVVAAAPGAGLPSGSVVFVDTTTGTDLGSATLTAGRATLNVNNLAVGSHVIAATYSGDGDFLTNSQTTTQAIAPLPTSSVAALKAVSLPSFTVSWSGSDAGGPGIAGYAIYVSDNGGPFNAWLSGTAQTSAVYQGTLGHSYQFYSVATDALGDVQPTPAGPQAATASLAGDKNGLYVAGVYQDVLGRLPDQAGLAFWTAQLDAGRPISNVAASIVHSAEYYAKEIIEPAYLRYLGRPADASGIAWWTAQLQGGMSDEQLEASLIASDEFYANAGGSDPFWIDAVYQSLLGRPADSAGQADWIQQLAGGMTRNQAALIFATSPERESARIQADYEHYLGRPADSAGLSFWLSQFSQGASNEDLITEFVSSSEYYQEQTS